ncbi:hypothetical protein INT47_005847 [Mucor saturninus]|uniref:Uncharacterized protein n=1 Tax=Mucor saturninus TaxID=64648 RepID=A0A8H7UW01_9FUNG|nr:hypothetical protein INT47_005847 [Mucor saturninus]
MIGTTQTTEPLNQDNINVIVKQEGFKLGELEIQMDRIVNVFIKSMALVTENQISNHPQDCQCALEGLEYAVAPKPDRVINYEDVIRMIFGVTNTCHEAHIRNQTQARYLYYTLCEKADQLSTAILEKYDAKLGDFDSCIVEKDLIGALISEADRLNLAKLVDLSEKNWAIEIMALESWEKKCDLYDKYPFVYYG